MAHETRQGHQRAGDGAHDEETPTAPAEKFTIDDLAFGIWRDREEVADVAAYLRKLRQPRYNRDGAPNEP